jgi:hypothetical protein
MAISLATEYPGRVDNTIPEYPLGAFQNETTPGANDGTPVDSEWGNDIQGLLQSILSESLQTPSGFADRVGQSQYLDGLKTIFESRLNANENYVAEHRALNGIDAGGTTAGVFVTRTLDFATPQTWASLAANQITLDAGKYVCWIRGGVNGKSIGTSHQIRLQQVSGTPATLVLGSSEVAGGPDTENNVTTSQGYDEFTLASSEVVELQHYASQTIPVVGLGAFVASGSGERYGRVEIWKVA